jgi:hypothetical protein
VPTTAADRFRAALELADAGIRLMRQNLERRNPSASPEEIDGLLREWLARRPPDAPGRPRPISPE